MSPLLVFGEDWGRHNSGCQRIVLELLIRGHDITWVNTIGTRRPSMDLQTLTRGLEKCNQWLFKRHEKSARLKPEVLSPLMWPSCHSRNERLLNGRLLNTQLSKHIKRQPELPIAITKVPLPESLLTSLPVKKWVYYSVDHVSAWPGCDRSALEQMETALIQNADQIIVTSKKLQERFQDFDRSTDLLTHGVDLQLWNAPVSNYCLPEFPRPLIVFWGLIDARLDVAMLSNLGNKMTSGTILMVGPQQNPPKELNDVPNLVQLGPVEYFDLPAIGKAADVLIMPYRKNEVTEYMQPVKLTEYMATGKPVVATDIPATHAWKHAIDIASDPEDFTKKVLNAKRNALSDEQTKERLRLQAEAWSAKAQMFLQLIN